MIKILAYVILMSTLLSCSSVRKNRIHSTPDRYPGALNNTSCNKLVSNLLFEGPETKTHLEALERSGVLAKHAEDINEVEDTFRRFSKRELPAEIKYLTDPKTAFLTKIKLIREATTSIDLSYFIFSRDEAGYLLLAELREAVERGVQVRVIFDSLGSMRGGPFHEEFKTLSKTIGGFVKNADGNMSTQRATAEVVIFNPLFNLRAHIKNFFIATKNLLNIVRGKKLEKAINFNIDRRSHDKIFLIDAADYDKSYAVFGGRNIGLEEFDLNPNARIQDIEVLVRNPRKRYAVQYPNQFTTMTHIQAYYNRLYHYRANKNMRDALVELSSRAYKKELKKFKSAQKSILEENKKIESLMSDMENSNFLREGFENEHMGLIHEIQNITRKSPIITGKENFNPIRKINNFSIVHKFFKDIKKAKNSIEIVSPYLHLTNEEVAFIHKWLKEDSSRTLKIVTNSLQSNNHVIPQAHFDHYLVPKLLKGFEGTDQIQIHAYGKKVIDEDGVEVLPSLLHAKYFIIDNKTAFIGTSNLDTRSRYFNSEVAIRIVKYGNEGLENLRENIKSLEASSTHYGSPEWNEMRNDPSLRLRLFMEKMASFLLEAVVYPLPYFKQ